MVHHLGVGAARDANLRSARWFNSLKDYLAVLKNDPDLLLAAKTIDQLEKSAASTKTAFLEAVQRAGAEVYREPLAQAPVWAKCAAHWGAGPGFKTRVTKDLTAWFEERTDLKARLEEITVTLWDQLVLAPLRRLVEENAPEVSTSSNVIAFPSKAA